MDGLDEKYLFAECVTKGRSIYERKLLELSRRAGKSMIRAVSDAREAQREYQEYVESWVHEIKTPMTAAELVCRNADAKTRQKLLPELAQIAVFGSKRNRSNRMCIPMQNGQPFFWDSFCRMRRGTGVNIPWLRCLQGVLGNRCSLRYRITASGFPPTSSRVCLTEALRDRTGGCAAVRREWGFISAAGWPGVCRRTCGSPRRRAGVRRSRSHFQQKKTLQNCKKNQ